MKSFCLFIFLFLGCFSLSAQVINSIPSSPKANESVVITFDAAQGNAGLKDYTGDVYAHTGVITSKSTSSSDWKYTKAGWNVNIPDCKMTSLGNNKWSLTITPDIRAYYGVPQNEKILKMAFVFRNENGTKTGKGINDTDLFLDVVDNGLYVWFISPVTSQQVAAGNSISFLFQASEPSLLKLYLDNEMIAETTSTTFSKTITFNQGGYFWVIAEASNSQKTVRDSLSVTVLPAPVNEPRPEGTRAGINIQNPSTVTFCLYAPGKQFVYLIGDFNNWQTANEFLMKKDGDYWWLTLPSIQPAQEYAFQYFVDGKLRIADPYTDKVLDPWNDPQIPSSAYPNLKTYPTGKTQGIVSVFQTGQTAYNWQVSHFQPSPKNKLVVYELLTRDFTEEHSFHAIQEKLDYLKNLGVNALELMPVNEFEGNDSWGYNPSFYFAVDKYYGRKNDFKALIDACHQKGIAVIMDMVLNHSYGQSPLVQLYWDATNNRPAANNPWYNTVSPNPVYSWGYDFNHESSQTQALVDSVCSYWMKEYKVDGFRFDFTKGFTQKPGDGWAYDASRIQILKRMSSEIYKRNPNAIVIFEHLTDNSEEIELADADILLWGNMNNPYCEGIMGYTEALKSDLSWSIYKERNFHQPHLLAYMESHDEERMMYKAKTYGNTVSNYNVKDLPIGLKRGELSACFYLPTPGPKMIWQFGELGYDYSINACSDGTISNDCRLTPKPVRWDYFADPDRKALYDVYYKLNYLKQTYPVFSSDDFSYSLKNAAKYFIWKSADMNAFVIGNFDVKSNTISLTLPKSGTWYEVLSGKTYDYASTTLTLTLQPGEYRLYADKKVDIPSGIEWISGKKSKIEIYPNPVTDILNVKKNDRIESLSVYSVYGQKLIQVQNMNQVNVSALSPGLYLLQIRNGGVLDTVKFMKK